jgi:hypothetical protein
MLSPEEQDVSESDLWPRTDLFCRHNHGHVHDDEAHHLHEHEHAH